MRFDRQAALADNSDVFQTARAILRRCRRFARRNAFDRAVSLGVVVVLVVLGLSPRGVALCFSGEHGWGETLTGWCNEHQVHHHGSNVASAEHADCGHSHGHEHGPHSDPCFDLPLGLDECRPQGDDRPDGTRLTLCPAANTLTDIQTFWTDLPGSTAILARIRSREGPMSASTPPQVRISLRAIVLQI